MVGVVSCRADILPFYAKRGYITVREDDFDTAGIAELNHITRRGLHYVRKQKINDMKAEMIEVAKATSCEIDAILNLKNVGIRGSEDDSMVSTTFQTKHKVLDMIDTIFVAKVGLQVIGAI